MRKFTLSASMVVALLFSVSISAQELYSEDFEDGGADARWETAEVGTTNAIDFAYSYSANSKTPAPNGGDKCVKLTANLAGAGGDLVNIAPTGGDFTGNYTLSFNAYLNFEGGTGSTEAMYFGIGESAISAEPMDGYAMAFTSDWGSGSDIRMYAEGSQLTIGCTEGVCLDYTYGYLDPESQNVSSGWEARLASPYVKSIVPANPTSVADSFPSNKWLAIELKVTSDKISFLMNGDEWGHVDLNGEEFAYSDGNIWLGLNDWYGSNAPATTHLLIDNVKVVQDADLANENNILTNVSIYPNPAKGMVNVSVEGKANFQLFNISGQSVMNMDIKGTTSVDISSLNSGMYFSRITSETGATKTLKLQVK